MNKVRRNPLLALAQLAAVFVTMPEPKTKHNSPSSKRFRGLFRTLSTEPAHNPRRDVRRAVERELGRKLSGRQWVRYRKSGQISANLLGR